MLSCRCAEMGALFGVVMVRGRLALIRLPTMCLVAFMACGFRLLIVWLLCVIGPRRGHSSGT